MSSGEALDQIEREFKRALGIAPREAVGVLCGPDGEPLTVSIDGLANSMRDRDVAAERYINLVRPTVEDPYEIWLVKMVTSGGEILLAKEYLGLYTTPDGGREALVVRAAKEQDMWTMHHFFPVREGQVDEYRRGRLLYGRR
jgi:hypothetical protein